MNTSEFNKVRIFEDELELLSLSIDQVKKLDNQLPIIKEYLRTRIAQLKENG